MGKTRMFRRPKKVWLDGMNEAFKINDIQERNRRRCMVRCMDRLSARTSYPERDWRERCCVV